MVLCLLVFAGPEAIEGVFSLSVAGETWLPEADCSIDSKTQRLTSRIPFR